MITKTNNKKQKQSGFTLVEMMVSISIFTIIITTGMGALLSVTRSYQASRDRTAVMNSMHFALESMVRDIRIGDSYYASSFSPQGDFGNEYRFQDSSGSSVLNIMGIPERGQLRYTFDTSVGSTDFLSRYQNDGGDVTNVTLLNDLGNIVVTNALFRVVGSDPNDNVQPSVFIYLRGEDTDRGVPFVVQTFISQRNLDV
jgi:prepilin-type N-terminal cleavage/methylation domain-containing protein